MKFLFILNLFFTVAFLSFGLLKVTVFNSKQLLHARIRRFLPKEKTSKSLFLSFLFHYCREIMFKIARLIIRISPKSYLLRLENKLNSLDGQTTLPMMMVNKILFAVGTFCVSLFITNIPVAMSLSILSYMMPDIRQSWKVSIRRRQILMELPFFLDLLGIILEAGISFDNGVLKVVQTRSGALYSEWKAYLLELSYGIPRNEAYSHLGARISLPEVDSFLRALQQGEKMGISIVSTIRLQSEQIKNTRKLQMQEKAMKLPVKMLFPLVFFIFPPIFLIIIGPGFIKIFELLTK